MYQSILTLQATTGAFEQLVAYYRREHVIEAAIPFGLLRGEAVRIPGQPDELIVTSLWPTQSHYKDWLASAERDRVTSGLAALLHPHHAPRISGYEVHTVSGQLDVSNLAAGRPVERLITVLADSRLPDIEPAPGTIAMPYQERTLMIPTSIRTVDYHTEGEPFRIVTDVPTIAGDTVAEKRVTAMDDPTIDGLRLLLCSEPRGHADMYGGFITPPDDNGAHFGVLFWHKDGFSTACGHGTIALGAWAIQSGRVPEDPSGTTDVVIDVPSGRVTAKVHSRDQRVLSVDFVNVASYVLHDHVKVDTNVGTLDTTISFGGAIYAQVAAPQTGFKVAGTDLTKLIELAREIKAQLADTTYAEHPTDDRLSGIYGVIFYEDLGHDEDGNPRQRNVTVFADGEVDRSPCGSGTCARVATLAATGALNREQQLTHKSIVDSVFTARIIEHTTCEGHEAVLTVVTGTAYKTGEHHFTIDPDDTITPGFVLR